MDSLKDLEELYKQIEQQYYETGQKIQEIKDMENIDNDIIFLLSVDQYRQYCDIIPRINCWWWLRSPASTINNVVIVYYDGTILESGVNPNCIMNGVRPALKLSPECNNYLNVSDNKIVYCGVTWKQIDEDLYISETPIAFDRFDEQNNSYAYSEIRQFLFNWYNERKEWGEESDDEQITNDNC